MSETSVGCTNLILLVVGLREDEGEDMSVINIGPYIRCKPGEKLYTWLPATLPSSVSMPDGKAVQIPLIVVNGIEDGPGIGFFGAMHGDELEGVQATCQIAEKLDPQEMKGTFFGIPVVNPSGYWARSRNNPDDNRNLNRVFPGKAEGTASERIAYAIYQYIVPQISCFMDYHAMGSRAWAISTIHIRHYIHRELWEKTRQIASICGFKYVSVIPGGVPNGMLDDINARDPEHGIPYISTEMSGVGTGYAELDEKVKMCIRAGLNIMKHLRIIQGKPEIPERATFISGGEWPTPPRPGPDLTKSGGWMFPYVEPADIVKKGQKLADLLDMFGTVVDSTYSPYDGIVHIMSSYPVIPRNSVPVRVAKFLSDEEL